jgi:hypothetical protein
VAGEGGPGVVEVDARSLGALLKEVKLVVETTQGIRQRLFVAGGSLRD